MKNTPQELQQVEALQESSSLQVKQLHTIVTDSGYYKYEFQTPHLIQYDKAEEPYIDFPDGLNFKMFDQHGTVLKTTIRCNNAKYFQKKELWELNNDVEATSGKQEKLNTEQLFWDAKEHTIYTDKFVKITQQGQVITGYGLESDEKMSNYTIRRPGGEIEVKTAPQQTVSN